MIIVWSRKAIAKSLRTRRKSQWTTDFSRNSGIYIVYNSYETCSSSSFSLTLVTPTSHFFAFHWLCCLLLAQAQFFGRTHLPLSPNSTTPTVQVIFRYLRPDAPVFNIHRIRSNCGHGDISVITPVLSIYLSTTPAVFTPAGHVNILLFCELW